MEITEKMYNLAKEVVAEYEQKGKKPFTEAMFLEREPFRLAAIITLNKWYKIYEEKDDSVLLYMDNDYSHWVDKKYLTFR
jgi:hypothetical protein